MYSFKSKRHIFSYQATSIDLIWYVDLSVCEHVYVFMQDAHEMWIFKKIYSCVYASFVWQLNRRYTYTKAYSYRLTICFRIHGTLQLSLTGTRRVAAVYLKVFRGLSCCDRLPHSHKQFFDNCSYVICICMCTIIDAIHIQMSVCGLWFRV